MTGSRVGRASFIATAALFGALLLTSACGDSGVDLDGTGLVRIMLTDAPADYLAVAEVCISQVYLQGGGGDEEEEADGGAGRVVLWEKGEGDAQCFDLLELQGVSAEVAETEVPAGTYGQLRFVIESASVTLAEGHTFSTGESTRDLTVPSGAQTGIKVILADPVVVESETVSEVTVDADVDANFVIQGNPETPAGIMGVLFTPVLVEIADAG